MASFPKNLFDDLKHVSVTSIEKNYEIRKGVNTFSLHCRFVRQCACTQLLQCFVHLFGFWPARGGFRMLYDADCSQDHHFKQKSSFIVSVCRSAISSPVRHTHFSSL